MEQYYQTRPTASKTTTDGQSNDGSDSSSDDDDPNLSLRDDFDKYRRTLLTREEDEGWRSEKRRYLKDMPHDVKRDTDIIYWWQVR